MANPSPVEQLTLEYINLLRTNPSGEYARLINGALFSEISGAISFFGVSLTALQTQLSSLVTVAPLAWNSNLNVSAHSHSDLMIQFDQQSHQLPGEPGLGPRINAAGYTNWNRVAENVFAFSTSGFYGHAGFVIDWGYDSEDFDASGALLPNWKTLGDGIQDPAGHRNTLTSANYTEIGVSIINETNPATKVGPLVTTHHLGNRAGYQAQFVGVVIDDRDNDNFYDLGEGMANVTVTLTSGAAVFTTTTWASGGYQIAVPAGQYQITFSGGNLKGSVIRTASIGASNVKMDAEAADAIPTELRGTDGDDVLAGNDLANILRGLGGNDLLIGGGGSDLLDGGTGFDTARYSGLRKTYAVDAQAEGGAWRSLIGFGPEGGTDTLANVEVAVFVDGKLLYNATFQRAPDPGGFIGWQGAFKAGISLADAGAAFASSPEFQATFGNLNNTQFVAQLYNFTLGRAGSSGEIGGWVAFLDSGQSRGDVLSRFSESAEHRGLTAERLTEGLWTSDETALSAARMYDSALGRLPDSGISGWVDFLKSGQSVLDMANLFINAPEFVSRFGNLSDQAFVEQLYQFTLRRTGNAAEVQGWVGFIASGQTRAEVLTLFSESPEHVSLTAPSWYNGISLLDQLPQSAQAALSDAVVLEDTMQFDLDALFGSQPGDPMPAATIEDHWEAALDAIAGADEPVIARLFNDSTFKTPVSLPAEVMIYSGGNLDYMITEILV